MSGSEGATKPRSSQGSGWGSTGPPRWVPPPGGAEGRHSYWKREQGRGAGLFLWLWARHSLEASAGAEPRGLHRSFSLIRVLTAGHKGLIGVGEPAQGILGRDFLATSSAGDISTRLSPHQEVATT